MNEEIVQTLNIEAFEKAVYQRDGSPQGYARLLDQLMELLGALRSGSGFITAADAAQTALYTRLAGAITGLFTDPRFTIPDAIYPRLCANHAQMHAIFRASGYETMDHILTTVGQRQSDDQQRAEFSGTDTLKLLACWALDSEAEIDFQAIARANPMLAAWSMIGMLSVGGSHTPKSYERRLMLMANRDLIAAAPLHPDLVQSAGDCYMHCSYTDLEDKHSIKRVINAKLFETVSAVLPIRECSRRLVRKQQPTIVVPLEWFGSHHAMYRCYAPSILELRERFRVIAIFRDSAEVNDEGQRVFDRCVKLGEQDAHIERIVRAIDEEQPDILYYPSLGMAAWYVALSNFRLAPIQVISPGHPATSMSRVIDYMVSDGDLYGDASDYTERLIALPRGTVRYIGRDDLELPPDARRSDGVVRIAVPAMATKLIPPFLQALQRVKSAAKVPVEFHFFPNMTGLHHVVISKDLRRWFPDAVVRHRHHYNQYLAWLSECDFVASTFPFGGTNSTVDAFLLGLPVVTLEGRHVHGRSDASMMRRVAMPEKWITHGVDEYVARCVELAEDREAREAVRAHLKAADVRGEFYGAGPEHLRGGFLRAFETLYEERLSEHEREAA